ncbi:MAG: decaprenyl-phosphate phosphoribosyltransferase [Patescibacteria group bacterium]
MKLIIDTIRLLRPRQWIKNFAVFAAILFSGELFNSLVFEKVLLGFFALCAVSSATYIVNDILDAKSDRLHPFKKFRPIANREVPVPFACLVAIVLVILALYVAFNSITLTFFLVIVFYLFLQALYSFLLKEVAVADILVIATGYILRVYAGEFASGFHISVWMLLTVISLSLFLAVGKRRSELTLVSEIKDANIASIRKTLSHYSERLLDVYATIFATSTFIFYSLFTFLENPKGFQLGFSILLPDYLPTFFYRKWLMITIIPVIYGLMRYIQDIYEKREGESPEKVLLSDKPLLATVIFWAILVIGIIYFINT